MSETKIISKPSESKSSPSGAGRQIVQNNLDYTLFSWSKQKGIAPIAVKHAEGVYLYDYDDKRIIDFSSGLMNVNIGHGDQRITEAVVKQMQEVSYVTPSCVTKVRGELGKKLAEILVTFIPQSDNSPNIESFEGKLKTKSGGRRLDFLGAKGDIVSVTDRKSVV